MKKEKKKKKKKSKSSSEESDTGIFHLIEYLPPVSEGWEK